MRLYTGIDLHSSNSYPVVIDETGRRVFKKKVPNGAEQILLLPGLHVRDRCPGRSPAPRIGREGISRDSIGQTTEPSPAQPMIETCFAALADAVLIAQRPEQPALEVQPG